MDLDQELGLEILSMKLFFLHFLWNLWRLVMCLTETKLVYVFSYISISGFVYDSHFDNMLISFTGFFCNCVLPATLNSTRVRHHRIEGKADEGEKKKLTSESNRFTSSNSSSSSSSSPSGTQTRGRSRTRSRRALAPASPLILGPSSSWWSNCSYNVPYPHFLKLLNGSWQCKKFYIIFILSCDFFPLLRLTFCSETLQACCKDCTCLCSFFFGGGVVRLQYYPFNPIFLANFALSLTIKLSITATWIVREHYNNRIQWKDWSWYKVPKSEVTQLSLTFLLALTIFLRNFPRQTHSLHSLTSRLYVMLFLSLRKNGISRSFQSRAVTFVTWNLLSAPNFTFFDLL